MRVLLDHSSVRNLNRNYTGRVGFLLSPYRSRDVGDLPYAYDNGRYSQYRSGREWSEEQWMALIDTRRERPPEWIVVPDVVTDAEATFAMWDKYAGWVQRIYGYRLAIAVQDGMTPDDIPQMHPQPEVIFIGGSQEWKRRTLWNWCQSFPRVHVGGVNRERQLWACHRAGAESVDGTGWLRGDQRQKNALLRYLRMTTENMAEPQLELEFARTFGPKVPGRSFVDRLTDRA